MNPYFNFRISLVANNLSLAIDSNNPHAGQTLTIQNPVEGNLDQIWTLMFVPDINGSVLFNAHRNLIAYADKIEQGKYIYLHNATDFLPERSNTWNISGLAYRPGSNTDLNMNAFGSGNWPPGTKVGLWEWRGPKENMEWRTIII